MRIGILSDSHGRGPITQRAVRLLIEHGAELLIHLGDICGEAVIDAMVHAEASTGELRPAVHIVFGNCDYDIPAMARYARSLGIAVHHPMGRLEIGGKMVHFTHGDSWHLMEEALGTGPAYLLHGHTHRVRDERIGPTRAINPGALYRASRHTVALLETDHDALDLFDVV